MKDDPSKQGLRERPRKRRCGIDQPTPRALPSAESAATNITGKNAVDRAWQQIQDMAPPADPRSSVLDERPSTSESPSTSLPTFLDDYEFVREIQRGGQGVVYEATQISTGRRVAIKVMRAGLFASTAETVRFEREIQLLVQLQHPNIVTVYDTGSINGCGYYVMDYIDGESLEDYINNHDLPVEDLLELFCQICDAVNVAHMRGVIHRDLKPGNIRIDRAGKPHILDFGLAKTSEFDVLADDRSEVKTQTGQFVGSVPWASPEQAQGRSDQIDIRTDVYAIGVLMYRALSGRYPYAVFGPLVDVLDNILTAEPTRPSAIRSKLDDEIDTIVLKCLNKNREQRYQSAGELARDIQRYLAGEPIEAKRDSSWYVLKKAVQRHRIRATIAGLVIMLVIHSIVALVVLNRRESHLRAEAERQANIAQAVNEFLNDDLLSAVQPENDGLDVTVRDVLDAASRTIVDQFEAQPMVEAAIRDTLGHTYMELGDWKSAVLHAQRSLELRRAELGTENESTLSSMNLVARLYRRLGQLEEASLLYDEMLDAALRILGEEHELTTKAISNSAYVLSEMGRDEEAISRNTRVLNIRIRELGIEHPDTMTSMNNQAYYHEKHGRRREAELMYARVLKLRKRVLGPEHPHTLLSMGNLAGTWSRSGRLEEAERVLLEQLALVRRIQGKNHPQTINSLSALGDLCRRQDRFDDAEDYLLEALQTQMSLGGDNHPRTATRMNELGKLYRDQKRYREAEMMLTGALAIYRTTVDETHPFWSDTLRALGICYLDQQRFVESEPLLIEAYELILSRLGSEHEQTRNARSDIIALFDAQGKSERAALWRSTAIKE